MSDSKTVHENYNKWVANNPRWNMRVTRSNEDQVAWPIYQPEINSENVLTIETSVINSGTEGKQASDGGSTSYYQLPSDAKELLDLIEHRKMNFSIGNIFKACYRLGSKEGVDDIYDLNKIIFFAEREKARIQRELDNG